MPVSFIGAGNFKGTWDANANSGSADFLNTGTPLLASSASATAGYDVATTPAQTASVGDYWQVTTAGSTEIDGESNWQLNDWCLYVENDSGDLVWQRLSVTDTVSAVIVGQTSPKELKNELLLSASAQSGPANGYGENGEVLFVSSSDAGGSNKYFEGSNKFTWNSNGSVLNLTGTLKVSGTIEATTLHTVEVTSSVLFEDGSTRFGDSTDDTHEFSGSVYVLTGLTSSAGISGSYFMGDGSGLTGITAGSALGNPVYVNAASSSVPFWGAADGGGEYGLTGSGRFNFYSASHDLQVTGTIRATNMYVEQKIYHEGDTDTYIDFGSSGATIEIRADGVPMVQLVEGSEDYLRLGTDLSYDVDIRMGSKGEDSTLWVDGNSANVGIRCAPSGTIQALTVSGSTLFGSASANSHEFIGSIYAEQDIVHLDDDDTKITFTNDQIDFAAGGVTLLTLDEDGQDLVTVGDGTDVDLKVRTLADDFTIFVEGSSDNVGIGTSSPAQKLSVSGSTVFGTAGGSDTHWFTGSVFVTDDLHVEDKIYGLNDPNTYIDLSNNDQIHTYAGGKLVSLSSTGGLTLNAFNDADLNFVVESANFSRCFHVDGGSDNVGIRCAPSGTIEALTVSGSTLFGSASANTHQFIGSVSVTQDISFAGNLHNASDDDTYIDFQDDQIRFYAGNVQFADYHEVAIGQDTTIFNGTGADIDFLVKSDGATGAGAGTNLTHTIFVEGSSARVGIAESSPGAQLDVSGSTILGRHDGDTVSYHQVSGTLEVTGNIGLNTPATDYSLTLPNLDTLQGRGMAYAWSTYSSARYKEDVTTMSNPVETAKKLRGVEFTWKESGHKDFGFIAEEVGKVLPQLVSYESDGKNAIGMDYSKITSLLVECVKYQQEQIETQENRIKQLEKKLKS